MNKDTRGPTAPRKPRGFTLVEIIVTVAIVAIIAAVALPSFTDSIRKGRRSEAFAALAALQQAQERWRGNRVNYAVLGDLPAIAANTPNGHYTLTVPVTGISAAGYTAIATAQGGQAQDASCGVLLVRVAGGNISYGSGAVAPVLTDPGRCWAR